MYYVYKINKLKYLLDIKEIEFTIIAKTIASNKIMNYLIFDFLKKIILDVRFVYIV